MEMDSLRPSSEPESQSDLRHDDSTEETAVSPPGRPSSSLTKFRILSSFWLFGMCNNFGYSVMLTAAYDILGSPKGNSTDGCSLKEYSDPPYTLLCHSVGTGAVLLADILPCIVVKYSAPFFMHRISYNVRMLVCVLFGAGGFVLTGLGGMYYLMWLSITGVAAASFGSGLGEIVFLSYSSHFDKSTISAWSSGTGAAGIAAGFAYSGLTQANVSAPVTLFIMIVVPLLQTICFYVWIVKPNSVKGWSLCNYSQVRVRSEGNKSIQRSNSHESQVENLVDQSHSEYQPLMNDGEDTTALIRPHVEPTIQLKNNYTFPQMLKLIKPLLKFMLPLMMVYMAEYYINQALVELLYFPASCDLFQISQQYRWLSTTYQIGVFLSRTSIICFQFKHLWILPILQFANVAILQSQVLVHYMPDNGGIWIVFAIILWEGWLGGLAYVNAFTRISTEISEADREFSMGIASVADTSGITISAFISILLHNRICDMSITWS